MLCVFIGKTPPFKNDTFTAKLCIVSFNRIDKSLISSV